MQDNFDDLKKLGIEDPNDPKQIDDAYNTLINKPVEAADMLKVDKELKETLTDEQVDEISKTVEEAGGADTEAIRNAEKEAEGEHEGYDTEVDVSVNPETGDKNVSPVDFSDCYITETFDEFIANHANDEIEMKITDDGVGSVIENMAGSGAEAAELSMFVDCLKQYKEGNVNAQEAYRCMPTILREFVDEQLKNSNVPRDQIVKYHNTLIKGIINNIIEDAALNNYIIDMNNEMAHIYEEFGKEANKFYEESMQDRIKSLEEFRATLGENEVAKRQAVDDIMLGLKESIEMNELKEAAAKIKIKKFDMEKPEKFVTNFNAKYEKSKYNIQDITLTMRVLFGRVGLSQEDCIIFLIVFCKFCMNYRPTDFKEHTFMYFIISNIIALAVAKDEYSETGKQVIDNIREVIALSRKRNNMPAKEETTNET